MDGLGSKGEYKRECYGKTINFVAPGVEKQVRTKRGGLVYGTNSKSSYDHINHGIQPHTLTQQSSWERARVSRQQRDADEDLKNHQEAKYQARVQITEEKKKDLEQLQQYNPWGKPAPGAPRWTRSGTLLARGDAPISRQGERSKGRQEEEGESNGYPVLGQPGSGAPLKSHDGSVDTAIRVHPETRFQKHLHKEVENSLRYKDEVEGRARILQRTESEEERLPQIHSRQRRYAKRLEDQMREAHEKKKQQSTTSPVAFFPWGQSNPLRDESGKLVSRQRHRPHPPNNEYQSLVEHMEKVGRREQTPNCTHPFTHGSKCKINIRGSPPDTMTSSPIQAKRIARQSQSMPDTVIQKEAEERHRERRREREEAKARRNSHHTLWEGGHEYHANHPPINL